MSLRKTSLVTRFLSAAMLVAGAAQAMEIRQFDKMADADQDEYVIQLIEGAQKVLRDVGRADWANEVVRLFTTDDPQSNISIGMTQLEITLAKGRVADLDRIAKDPNARRLEVEDVMIVTLRKNSIELPRAFLAVMKDWKPKFPSKKP